jgi:endo-1,4-beta-xylanase
LYILAAVTDPNIDVASSNAYEQDSVELFIDPGNAKNGSFRAEDAQLRINVNNVHSFGSGDAAAQEARLRSATKRTSTGYVVEAAVTLLGHGGVGTFQGVDFQVNDGTNGARTATRSWAEPTGTGYQTTARWGVGQLVGSAVPGWRLATTYHAGDWVTYQGSFWTALWYSANQAPGDPNGAWQQMATADDGMAIWTPSRVFTRATPSSTEARRTSPNGGPATRRRAIHAARGRRPRPRPTARRSGPRRASTTPGTSSCTRRALYVAQWWTRNEAPGPPNGPWKPAG